jgi:hypothetical protein
MIEPKRQEIRLITTGYRISENLGKPRKNRGKRAHNLKVVGSNPAPAPNFPGKLPETLIGGRAARV